MGFPSIFPTSETEDENRIICVRSYDQKAFAVLMSECIPDLNFYNTPQQSFPFYTYEEDGTNRRENITGWALQAFRSQYQDETISKWEVFHYVYAVLHHPEYRETYQANLKRELPRLPFLPDFWSYVKNRKTIGRHTCFLRRPTRIPTRLHRDTRYVPQLARREDEALQRQDLASATMIFSLWPGFPPRCLTTAWAIARHWIGLLINTASRPTNEAASPTTPTAPTTRSISSN